MRWKLVWKKPLLTLTQGIALSVILFGLFVALDLNRRAQAGRLVGKDEETLRAEYDDETARKVELEATLVFVESEEYVKRYARDEAGKVLPGEKKVVPVVVEADDGPSVSSDQPSDPAQYARPWQAWWQLLTDTPMPTRR
jgi:cell division protein FtsB